MTVIPQLARSEAGARLIELERRRLPGLIGLLRPLSLALRAELELVRAMRLRLLPHSDPGLEADLWSSQLLQARDVSAVVLLPEVRHALHRELQKHPEELEAAWQIVEQHHRSLDPVILREERTTYLALLGEFERAERQLGPVIHALRKSPQDRELRRWVGRFLNRLPEGTRDSEAARALRLEESRHLVPESVGYVQLGIRRVPKGLWITSPPEHRAVEVGVPLTKPVRLSVAWPGESGWSGRTVELAPLEGSVSRDPADFEAEPLFVHAPVGRLRLRTADQHELDLHPDGERPLLYIRLDDELADLPAVLHEQLEDLDWRHEVASLSESAGQQRPLDWRTGARAGNAEADATMLCSADGHRLLDVIRSLDGGFGDWIDLDWAAAHGQPIVLLTDEGAGWIELGDVEEDAPPGELAHQLSGALSAAADSLDPEQGRRRLRGALVDIERKREQARIERFLESRFQITPAEQELLRGVQVAIDGKPGFLVGESLAVIRREPQGHTAETATAVFGEETARSSVARRLRFDSDFVLYQVEAQGDSKSMLVPASAPVRREDRWSANLRSARGGAQVAGLVREPEFPDVPGSPHALALRLPQDSDIESGEQVFGPLVRDGELIGVVYSVTRGADFGGEGDLAYALPIDRLLSVLNPPQRAARVDRRVVRPGGDWAPQAKEIEIGRHETGDLERVGKPWIFSEDDTNSASRRFQLEARWNEIEVGEGSHASAASAETATFFPPNDCTELLAGIAAEQSGSPGETPSQSSAKSLASWLDRFPELSPAAVSKLEALADELLDGRGPVSLGLRWVLRGVDPQSASEASSETSARAEDVHVEAGVVADRLGHRGTVRSLALAADGSRALTAGNSHPDRTVKIWDLRRGRLLHSLDDQAEGGSRTAVAISGDGGRAATSYQEEMRLWDVESGELRERFKEGIRPPWIDACFAGSHYLLASASDQAFLFELESGAGRALGTGGGEHLGVAASGDGRLLAILRRDGITVWRHEKGELVILDSIEQPVSGELFPFQRPPLRFTADDRLLFGSPQMVWMEGAGAQPLESQRLANIADLDRQGGALWVTSPGTFQIIDPDGEPLSPELQCDGREIACAALSADGSTVLAADYDHHLWVWWLGEPRPDQTENGVEDASAVE